MEHIIMDWKQLKVNKVEDLANASNMVHHAAQAVSLAGKYLLPEKEDDSHTAMEWLAVNNWLLGRVIRFPDDYLHLALNYNDFSLLLVDEDFKVLNQKSIDNFTKQEMFLWLKNTLVNYGIDVELIKDKMHYDLPPHDVDEGNEFQKPEDELLEELSAYRTNGHLIIKHFSKEFHSAQPVFIWPHHFDEACYVPLLFNDDEVVGSIGFGLAVPDDSYNTPYFYVTAWRKDGVSYKNLPNLTKPGKWHEAGWHGQVLHGSDLVGLNHDAQAKTAFEFMQQAINNARGLVGRVYK